jgi:hypothetical protein
MVADLVSECLQEEHASSVGPWVSNSARPPRRPPPPPVTLSYPT